MNAITITTHAHKIGDRGPEADVTITESNGDKYTLRVLAMPNNKTEIGDPANGEIMRYLVEKYSTDIVLHMHSAVLGASIAG